MAKNKYKYILSAFIVAFSSICFFSCVDEKISYETREHKSVALNIQMPVTDIKSPMTRAGASDFDRMSDMNIVIAEGATDASEILHIFHFNFADVTEEGQIQDGLEVYYTDEVSETLDGSKVIRSFKVQFTKEWLTSQSIPTNTCRFYVVANWGSAIDKAAVTTVGELKALKVTSEGGIIYAPNVMFGEVVSETSGTHTHPTPDGSETTEDACRLLNIELQRTAALVTVTMNTEGLNPGIVIIPKQISLHNVPNTCTLGGYNTVDEADVTKDGEYKDGASFAGGMNLVGSGNKWLNQPNYGTSAGKHYTTENGSLTDVTDQTVYPLFLYENYHGEGFGATGVNADNQWLKRPASSKSDDEADIEAASGNCSYLKITADYTDYTKDNSINDNPQKKGKVEWRFFLGSNVTDNFDVMRNTNYQVDLILSGTAIGEGEASWRVNTALESNPPIVGEKDMVVGGGGEMFCVEFVTPPDNQNMKLVGSDADFVYAFVEQKGKPGYWQQISTSQGAEKWYMTADKQIWFYVKPFLPEDPGTKTERKTTIYFTPASGDIKDAYAQVSFTQYRPLTISVGWEEIQDGLAKDDEDIKQIKNIIETYYNYKFKTSEIAEPGENDEPFTFYLDRIDRASMPWGFSGITLDKNQTSGFENVYHLIDPKTQTENCPDHVDYAKHYLPTGKGFRENITTGTLGDYIDYTNGSCMMHAAMENHFQQYYNLTTGDAQPHPDKMLLLDLPQRPANDPNDSHVYGWCVPSIVGWQLIEKINIHRTKHVDPVGEGVFDPKYPILKWTSYWTSNTESDDIQVYNPANDGKVRSFVYQFDTELDKYTVDKTYPANLLKPRTMALPYRLLNIDPKYLKENSDVPSGQ